jgi:hypothetical protein
MFYNGQVKSFSYDDQQGDLMSAKEASSIDNLNREIENLAGAQVASSVMEGNEKVSASSNPMKIALWVKGAIDRLDGLTDAVTREQILLNCGYQCILVNTAPLDSALERRRKYPSDDAFIDAEIANPPRGFRFERDGDLLVQFYTPRSFGPGMRCYCGLMRALPEGMIASKTFCQCSRGFVEKYWQGILGRAVAVELKETALTGADECRFLIHL